MRGPSCDNGQRSGPREQPLARRAKETKCPSSRSSKCAPRSSTSSQALDDEWEQATEGKRTLRRSIITRDRNDPDRYLILAFFDSYESAMENSNLPETAAFAEKQMPLARRTRPRSSTSTSSTTGPEETTDGKPDREELRFAR